jgi:hypothetical protein
VDIAVDLVEIYLRANGYLTLSEWQVQTFNDRGQWETLTDIDIFGVRLPGPVYAALPTIDMTPEDLAVEDPALFLEPETADVIIGEVKEGEVHFNTSIARPETLKTALHRVEWLYATSLDDVCADVTRTGLSYADARGGGRVRTRLVAFGQAPAPSINIIPIGHILERSQVFLDRFDDHLKSAKLSNAAAATLKLLRKSGFRLEKRW